MTPMTIHTRRCGDVRYESDSVITFPEGLVGFERLRKFIIIPDEDAKVFNWLLSIEDENIGFLLIDPNRINSRYVSELPVQPPVNSVFCIVTMRSEVRKSTVNFKAPIVIDTEEKVGRQLIMNSEKFPVEYSFLCHDTVGEE